jgi:anti-sigma regulatory factor (Ser/Thr protein kinase)
MSGDAFKTEPAVGVGRAAQASTQAPLLDQEFDSGTLYALRAAVQAHAGQAGLSEDRVGEVVLAIHELAANAIAHGAGHGRLRMWERGDALSCEVVDAGPVGAGRPTGPPDSPPGPSEAADPWPTTDGHGLWLVRQVADQLDLRSGPRGTRAMVIFALPRPEDH